eukprot:superscaffoldBa00003915_g17944
MTLRPRSHQKVKMLSRTDLKNMFPHFYTRRKRETDGEKEAGESADTGDSEDATLYTDCQSHICTGSFRELGEKEGEDSRAGTGDWEENQNNSECVAAAFMDQKTSLRSALLIGYDGSNDTDEFLDRQMLQDTDIKSVLVNVTEEEEFHHMDMVWTHLSELKSRVIGKVERLWSPPP